MNKRPRIKFKDKQSGKHGKSIWDFSKIKDGKIANIEYTGQERGKTIQIVYVDEFKKNPYTHTHTITHIDCKACGNQWKIEDRMRYETKFEVRLQELKEFKIFYIDKVRCKKCNYLYDTHHTFPD